MNGAVNVRFTLTPGGVSCLFSSPRDFPFFLGATRTYGNVLSKAHGASYGVLHL